MHMETPLCVGTVGMQDTYTMQIFSSIVKQALALHPKTNLPLLSLYKKLPNRIHPTVEFIQRSMPVSQTQATVECFGAGLTYVTSFLLRHANRLRLRSDMHEIFLSHHEISRDRSGMALREIFYIIQLSYFFLTKCTKIIQNVILKYK